MTGAEDLLLRSDTIIYLWDWSRDGKFLVYTKAAGSASDIWMLPLSPPREPVQLTNTPTEDQFGQISPDGHWLAYASGDRGQMQIYVKPIVPSPALWLISKDGGTMPRWSENGELFYRAPDGQMMVVPYTVVATGSAAEFKHGAPRALFGGVPTFGNVNAFTYQPTADGQRFLIAAPVAGSVPPISVALKWPATLQK